MVSRTDDERFVGNVHAASRSGRYIHATSQYFPCVGSRRTTSISTYDELAEGKMIAKAQRKNDDLVHLNS